MGYFKNYLDPRTLARVSGLSLRARLVVEGTVTGLHRSPYHGFSADFTQHREYAPGDDLKYVDWKVFGRTDKFYLKQFEQETNLFCMIAVDASESMRFRGPRAAMSKWEYAQCLAAAVAYLVLRQQDRAGLTVFADTLRVFLQPDSTGGQWQQVIDLLEGIEPAGKTSLAVLRQLADRLTRRGLVVIISDFLADISELENILKYLRFNNQEVIIFHVVDQMEVDFDLSRPVVFRGLETGERLAIDPRLIKNRYRELFRKHLFTIQRICHALKMDHVRCITAEPLDRKIREYLTARARRRFV